jgi:hypothetical protein
MFYNFYKTKTFLTLRRIFTKAANPITVKLNYKDHFYKARTNKFVIIFRSLKLRCDSRFQRAFTACSCVFKVTTLIGSNQGNYFENATTCSERMRKTLVATQLKDRFEIKRKLILGFANV